MEQSLEIPRTWDRQPEETDKAWAAFQAYREMPLFGPKENKRNFENLAAKLGHNTTGTIQLWSAKYNWQERCRAYDASSALKIEDYRVASKIEATKSYYYNQSLRLQAMGEIIDLTLEHLREKLTTPDKDGHYTALDPKDLKGLANAIQILDSVSRRMLNLPTVFKQGQGEEPLSDDVEVMVIGDKDPLD